MRSESLSRVIEWPTTTRVIAAKRTLSQNGSRTDRAGRGPDGGTGIAVIARRLYGRPRPAPRGRAPPATRNPDAPRATVGCAIRYARLPSQIISTRAVLHRQPVTRSKVPAPGTVRRDIQAL